MNRNGETKAELIQALKDKARKASPLVKRTFLSGLERRTKTELKSMLRKIRVTSGGDIRLT